VSIALVGTYPPTKCGIATFTASLARALSPVGGSADRVGIVRCVDAAAARPRASEVVAELIRGSTASRRTAAAELDTFDVVVVQHEFGIYGGTDGDEVVDLVEQLDVPAILVLHTVLERPSAHQQEIVESLAAAAQFVVVQSQAALARLHQAHDIPPEHVRVIPHGARPNLRSPTPLRDPRRRPTVLTWGLISAGKGIEYGIEAVARLGDLEPRPRYVVIGQTHPEVIRREGEAYRESLRARVSELHADDLVEFDNGYLDAGSILARIRDADVVLLPYLSREQVVSGVLVEAIASGKPVVATRFPHAVELLGEGSGVLVPHEDTDAISAALRSLLTDRGHAAEAAAVARRQAPRFFWENVARAYRRLAVRATRRHLEATQYVV
jgi:glycosyltransferase involved in cell wall biosynthesis